MDPIVTSALISGGSSLLGGLLGKDKGPSARAQRNDMKKIEEARYKWLVKGAQRAGFNPLTVLGAAGQTAGRGTTTPQSPLGWKSALGDAIKQTGQVLASYDPVEAEGRQLDNELKRRQLAAFDNEGLRQGANAPTKAEDSQLERRFENLDPAVQGGLGTVDLGSLDAADMRVDQGPLKNRYVVRNPLDPTKTYVMPSTFTPQEGIEGIAGDVGGEAFSFAQAIQMGRKTMEKLGIKEVLVHPRTGVVTAFAPQGLYQDEKPTLTARPTKSADWGIDLGPLKIDIWKDEMPTGKGDRK